jgi:hypothetical protein
MRMKFKFGCYSVFERHEALDFHQIHLLNQEIGFYSELPTWRNMKLQGETKKARMNYRKTKKR